MNDAYKLIMDKLTAWMHGTIKLEVTLAAVKEIEGLSKEDEITMFYNKFGDSSINFVIRLWVATPDQPEYLKVGSETIMRIKKPMTKMIL